MTAGLYLVLASALIGQGFCFTLGNLLTELPQLPWMGQEADISQTQALQDTDVDTSKYVMNFTTSTGLFKECA